MGSVLYLSSLNDKRTMRQARRGGPEPTRLPEPRSAPRSILRLGHNVCAVARAERLALLVDADAYFRAFYQAALNAKRSITILAWDFNSQTRLHFDAVEPGGAPVLLGEFLNFLTRRPSLFTIPKATRPEHVRENAGALDFALTPADISAINAEHRK